MATAKQTTHHAELPPEWDVTKMWATFRIPGVNMDAFVASQQRTFEALTEANRVFVESLQTVAKRQAEMMNAGMEKTVKATQELVAASKPADKAAKQVAFAREAFQMGFANMRELSDLIAKATAATVEVCGKRYAETLDEMQSALGNGSASK
jgi:phasin family protein